MLNQRTHNFTFHFTFSSEWFGFALVFGILFHFVFFSPSEREEDSRLCFPAHLQAESHLVLVGNQPRAQSARHHLLLPVFHLQPIYWQNKYLTGWFWWLCGTFGGHLADFLTIGWIRTQTHRWASEVSFQQCSAHTSDFRLILKASAFGFSVWYQAVFIYFFSRFTFAGPGSAARIERRVSRGLLSSKHDRRRRWMPGWMNSLLPTCCQTANIHPHFCS